MFSPRSSASQRHQLHLTRPPFLRLPLVLAIALSVCVGALSVAEERIAPRADTIHLDDEIFRHDARDRLLILLQEAEAQLDTKWFAVRVEAQAIVRELSVLSAPASRRWLEPKRIHELRSVLSQLEARALALRTEGLGGDEAFENAPNQPSATQGLVPPPIVGRVTDAVTGVGIPGVTVHAAYDWGGIYRSAVTDALGDYALENFATFPDASYYVLTGSSVPTSAPWIDEVWDDVPCFGGLCDLPASSGQLIPLLPGQASPVVNLALSKGGQISGDLVDGNTLEPLPLAFLRFYDDQGTQLDFDLNPTDGTYETPALPAGQYYVRAYGPPGYVSVVYPDVSCPGFSCDVTEGELVEVTSEGNTDASFELVLSASISGTITDEVTGDPLDNLLVRVYDEMGNEVYSDRTESDGTYKVQRLLGGRHYAQVFAGMEYFSELWDGFEFNAHNPQIGTPIDLVLRRRDHRHRLSAATRSQDDRLGDGGSGWLADHLELLACKRCLMECFGADRR